MVEQQSDVIDSIETTAVNVQKDMEAGYAMHISQLFTISNVGSRIVHSDKAIISARGARKKRWICFLLTLVILAIIAIIVAVVITNNTKK